MKTKMLFALAAVGLLSAAPAHALDKVRITDSTKTVEKRQSNDQKLPKGTTSLTTKELVQTFTLQRMAPDVPEQVTVKWVVLRESRDGRLEEATRGESVQRLPLGQAATVSTAPFSIMERSWVGRHHAGSVSEEIAGYGLRLLNDAGTVLAEKYKPTSIEKQIDWDKRVPEAGSKEEQLIKLRQEMKQEHIDKIREERLRR